MILLERQYQHTLTQLVQNLDAGEVETWTFDDPQTRREAEAEFAGRGINAKCRSAYKPLVCAFCEELSTEDLIAVTITYPRHPDATHNRFLLEAYPLIGMYPGVNFETKEGPESEDLPCYEIGLTYRDGRTVHVSVLAPNRSHQDYSQSKVLSPCGWLIVDHQSAALETEYEALFHQTMKTISSAQWKSEPYFEELNIAVTLPVQDEDLGYGDEVLSLCEALHEEFYFSVLEVFQRHSGRCVGDRRIQPGQIVPEIRYGRQPEVIVEMRSFDGASISDHYQTLDSADRPLSQLQINDELGKIPGHQFHTTSFAGRKITAVHHQGKDQPIMISAGQHANETTAPVGTLRAAQRLALRKDAHFTISPLENPDGYALHQRLIAGNSRHMHHAARYTSLGDDLEFRKNDCQFEKAIRVQARQSTQALLHVNCHGYPAHEWTRPLSGYVPHGFETWTIPKGFFLIMRYNEGWNRPARALMEKVTHDLNNVQGLREYNDAQIALFKRHAGEIEFETLNGFLVMIGADRRSPVPMTLITEYPDETIYGDDFRAGHEAQMATVLAAYDALQNLTSENGLVPV